MDLKMLLDLNKEGLVKKLRKQFKRIDTNCDKLISPGDLFAVFPQNEREQNIIAERFFLEGETFITRTQFVKRFIKLIKELYK